MKLRTHLKLGGVLIVLGSVAAGFLCIRFYPYVFGPRVSGEVLAIERLPATVADNDSMMDADPAHLGSPSFTVSIRAKDGEIFAVSTKDRQWAVVEKGDCVNAKLFAHPPWDQKRSGTYFGARLTGLEKDCSHLPKGAPGKPDQHA